MHNVGSCCQGHKTYYTLIVKIGEIIGIIRKFQNSLMSNNKRLPNVVGRSILVSSHSLHKYDVRMWKLWRSHNRYVVPFLTHLIFKS